MFSHLGCYQQDGISGFSLECGALHLTGSIFPLDVCSLQMDDVNQGHRTKCFLQNHN